MNKNTQLTCVNSKYYSNGKILFHFQLVTYNGIGKYLLRWILYYTHKITQKRLIVYTYYKLGAALLSTIEKDI